MNLKDIITREIPPKPWAEGEKIPWNDPDFSERMLREHLSQNHDMASRRSALIDRHVSWIHNTCLHDRPARVLDLGCGPGLYAQRLARLGHECIGIDFSPASVAHARSEAAQGGLNIHYTCGDIRTAPYGSNLDLVILIFGEFNVFPKDDARLLLHRIHASLKPGGLVLLEPQTYEAVLKSGKTSPCWHSGQCGLFSPNPHLWLEEHFWHSDCHAATTRYFIVDATTGAVQRYASTTQSYTDDELNQMLTEAGFCEIARLPSLTGSDGHRHEGLFVVMAAKN